MPTGLWLYSYLGLWGLIAIQTIVLTSLVRQLAEMYEYWVSKDEVNWGLPLGTPAPSLPELDLYGRSLSLGSERGRSTLLLFVSRGCSACHSLMSSMYEMDELFNTEVVLIVASSPLSTRHFMNEFRREERFSNAYVLADEEREWAGRYDAHGTPFGVVVDEGGEIGAKGVIGHFRQAKMLIHQSNVRHEQSLEDIDNLESDQLYIIEPVNQR